MPPPTCTQCAGRTMGGSRACLRNPVMCAKCCRYHGGCARHTALPGAAAVAAAPLPPPAASPAQAAAPQPSAPSAVVPPPGSITAQLAQIWQALQHVSSVVAASSAAQVHLQPPQAVVPTSATTACSPHFRRLPCSRRPGNPLLARSRSPPPGVADGSAPPPLLGLLPPPPPPPASHLNAYPPTDRQLRTGTAPQPGPVRGSSQSAAHTQSGHDAARLQQRPGATYRQRQRRHWLQSPRTACGRRIPH